MEICKSLFQRIQQPINKVRSDSGFELEDINQVVMVGGSSHMPTVVNYIHYILGKTPDQESNPEQMVALGVGIYAGIKQRFDQVKDVLLTDICPFSLGVGVVDHYCEELKMSPIIERNSTLPISREEYFTTTHPKQNNVSLHICQGEHRYLKDNKELGVMEIGIEPREEIQGIKVRFTYDINGILVVDVTACSTGKIYNKCIVSKSCNMSEREIEKRIEELATIRLHPRKQDKNRLVLSRAERIYEESIGERRFFVDQLIDYYNKVLASEDLAKTTKMNYHMDHILSMLEEETGVEVLNEIRKYMVQEGMVK